MQSEADEQALRSAEVNQAAKTTGNAGRVAAGWILLILGFGLGFSGGPVFIIGFILQIITLVLAIVLTRTPHNRIHGMIILIIWGIGQLLGFFSGFLLGLNGRYRLF